VDRNLSRGGGGCGAFDFSDLLLGQSQIAGTHDALGLLGVARAFAMPALQALAPNLVPRAILRRIVSVVLAVVGTFILLNVVWRLVR